MDLKKRIPAYATVEAAVVMGVILFALLMILRMGLYLHDKNILIAAAQESAQVAKERERMDDERPAETYFQERIRGKLLYFSGAECSCSKKSGRFLVNVRSTSALMSVKVSACAAVTEPETGLRENIEQAEEKENNDG